MEDDVSLNIELNLLRILWNGKFRHQRIHTTSYAVACIYLYL
jgi:hypothetical protein